MGTRERRAREKENLRRAILDAAREFFVTEGYDAVTMRKIAEKIEYSPTTIYLHFKDKEEILVCLSEEGFSLLKARLDRLDLLDPVERLRQGGRVYLEFALSQPHYYKIMFEIAANPLAHGHKPEDSLALQTFGFIEKCVTEAIAQGRFAAPGEHDALLPHVIWAHIHGAASLALSGRLGMLPDEAHGPLFEAVVETTLRGLQAA